MISMPQGVSYFTGCAGQCALSFLKVSRINSSRSNNNFIGILSLSIFKSISFYQMIWRSIHLYVCPHSVFYLIV